MTPPPLPVELYSEKGGTTGGNRPIHLPSHQSIITTSS